MTEPEPIEPLITLQALRSWTQQEILETDTLAQAILMGVSIKLWEYGNPGWTAATLPPNVRLMGELKAKNFYEHPTGARHEGVDVLTETFVNEVLMQLTFTQAEIDELAQYKPDDPDAGINVGAWILTTTRGPLETHGPGTRGAVHYKDSWDTDFPLLAENYFLGPR